VRLFQQSLSLENHRGKQQALWQPNVRYVKHYYPNDERHKS